MRTIKRILTLLMCLCLLISCAALAEEAVLLTDEAVSGAEVAPPKVNAIEMNEGQKPVKPTKVTITKGKSATIQVGKKLTLEVELFPTGAASKLTWKSSDTKVATVSKKGVVTAKKKGTAKITVKTKNGKKASIKITVKPKPIELAGYIGEDIKKTAKKLGMKTNKEKWDDELYIHANDSYANLRGTDCDEYYWNGRFKKGKPRIYSIEIEKGTKYTLCGVRIGMSSEEALEKMTAYANRHFKNWDYEYDPDSYISLYPYSMSDMSPCGIYASIKNNQVAWLDCELERRN